jgi:hypothetical protein
LQQLASERYNRLKKIGPNRYKSRIKHRVPVGNLFASLTSDLVSRSLYFMLYERSFFIKCVGAAGFLIAASALPIDAARADTLYTGSCVGSRGSVNCVGTRRAMDPDAGVSKVIKVRAPETSADAAESATREQRWANRCRPQLRQDQYGVSRYYYAAPNCDLGKSSD